MNKYDVIGLMSGTSLDGLDIAYIQFFNENDWKYKIMQCETISYAEELSTKLVHATKLSASELKKLDIEVGKWMGQEVKQFMNRHQIHPDLIASHGHTIFHQPEIGFTQQIGDGYQIMIATGIKTIGDFRSLDVALGGHGAPLVPIGDKLLFKEFDFCLNLGGFSNISFDSSGQRIAYDICPVNTVLNYVASQLNVPYDKGGEIAKSGAKNAELLQNLNALSYYNQSPPKSLGIEWVQQNVYPLLDKDTPENVLITYCHHIVQQIISSIVIERHTAKFEPPLKMLVTGGGAKNSFLIDLLTKEVKGKVDIIVPEDQLIDFKEAIIFAFLGLLRNLGMINTLKSVTGAKIDSSGGLIYDNLTATSHQFDL